MKETKQQMLVGLISLIVITVSGLAWAEDTAQDLNEKRLNGTALIWLDAGKATLEVDYTTRYSVQHPHKHHIIHQYSLDFYEGTRFVGTYYYWNELGSSLPDSITRTIHDVKIDKRWHAVLTERYFDVGWRDGKRTEEELTHWFKHTFWKFNSVVPVGKNSWRYTLQSTPGMPDLATYLRQSGFTVNATFQFKEETYQIETKAEQEAEGDACDSPSSGGLSVAAIALGIVTRSSPLGKTAAITSSVLLVASLGFLA